MAEPNPECTTAADWFHQLYGSAESGWLTLFSLDRTSGQQAVDWTPVDDLDTLAATAEQREPSGCVWFGVATRAQRTPGRGRSDDCAAIPGLWVDIDVAGPGHAAVGRLASDIHHARRIVASFPLPPTAVVHTGGGLQAWWLFSELVELDDETRTTLAAWGATWARLGRDHNVDLDNVFDAARVMRLPGTTNRKEGLARPVVVESAEWARRYGLDDIEQHLDDAPEPPTHRSGARLPYIGPERPGDAYSLRHTGGDVLARHGFTLAGTDRNGDEHWTRPGKDTREGSSATVYADDGHTTIWSDTVRAMWPTIELRRPYDPFGLVVHLEHNGDFGAATRALRAAGYGADDTADADALGLSAIGDEPWPEPKPLVRDHLVPTFPLDSLPEWARGHALAVADSIQVPVDLSAMLIIGALSAAATGRANVHASATWSEPVNLYLLAALRSGAGKSPAVNRCIGWLYRWERERIAAATPAYEDARVIARHAAKQAAKAENNAASQLDVLAAHAEARRAEADIPRLPRLIVDDVTPEAVAGIMATHSESLAVVSSEADLFDMLLRGKVGQRQNMNLFLKAWSGDPFIRDRKGGSDTGPESSEIRRPLLTICTTVQPSVLGRIQSDDEMVSRGFAARFMFTMPPDLIGTRDQSKRFGGDALPTQADYDERSTALASRWATWGNPADLRLDSAAAGLLLAFLADVEPRLAKGAELEHLGEWANKLYGSVVRYAGLLHLAEGRPTTAPVDAATVSRALALGTYWLETAATVLTLHKDRTAEQAQTIITWIAEQGMGRVTLAQLQSGCRRPGEGLDRIADYVPPVELLIESGWLRWEGSGDWRTDVGVRRAASPEFAVLPSVVGNPQTARYLHSPRTAYMGERVSLSLPTGTGIPPSSTRYADCADSESASPVDNSAAPAPDLDWMDP